MPALISESGSSDLAVPATISALLAARLDQLAPAERTVLESGSVEGQSFHQGSVQVMAPDERDVPGRLIALVHKDLVRPDRSVLPGEDAFRFRHLLIRDAAYQALAKADRAELHERFARWLEERGAGLAERDEITGYHLEQAHRYRCELGPADDKARRLAADAAAHLDTAGRRALDRGDTGAALTLLERAEALLPPREVNLSLQESLIRALGESGRLDDAIARAEWIANECAATGDRVGELRARLQRTRWRANLDPEREVAELSALAGEARPLIERDGDAAARAALEQAVGYVDYYRCRNSTAFAAFTRAMQHAREAGDLWFETSLRAMAAASITLGPAPRTEALQWLDDAEARSATYQPELGMRKSWVLAEVGRFDGARSLLADTMAQMNERGLALSAAYAVQTAWQIEMLAGDYAAAERAARQGCEQLDRLGERSVQSTEAGEVAEALYALGRYEEAEQWALRAQELGNSDDLATQMFALGVRSRVLARNGHIGAALALASQADRLAATSEDPRDSGDAALNLAEIMYLTGDPRRAQEMTQHAIKCYLSKGAVAFAARARHLAAAWASPSAAGSEVTQAKPRGGSSRA
jgi:tetratricopeptide (TPR) repeat protein